MLPNDEFSDSEEVNIRSIVSIENTSDHQQYFHGYHRFHPMGNILQPFFNGLYRSPTVGTLPNSGIQQNPITSCHHIDRKVPSRNSIHIDESVEEFSPEQESPDDVVILNSDPKTHNGTRNEPKNGLKKNKYTDTVLKPDCSLPPVIRRRNQNRRKKMAASMVDSPQANGAWEQQPPKIPQKMRSQSISDDQWNRVVAMPGHNHPVAGYPPSGATSEVGGIAPSRRGYNTMGTNARPGKGHGMVSSASFCDLNTLAQHPIPYPNMHSAQSFQQLSMMGYDPNMMWLPCPLCQPPPMYPPPIAAGGMKRTTSNVSMNLSSMGSEASGYPWSAPAHMHHHMGMYPGYYPGGHQHMMPQMSVQGSSASIPDSVHSYNKASPAASFKSSSRRCHKSSKPRSFNNADMNGRRSRGHSQHRSIDSNESLSSSGSEDHNDLPPKSHKIGSLSWQCDHCTFINPGHVHSCGMCSKCPVMNDAPKSSRRSEQYRQENKQERQRKTTHEENTRNLSDYDNERTKHPKEYERGNRSRHSSSIRSFGVKSRNRSRHRDNSGYDSSSATGSEAGNRAEDLERQLKALRLVSSSRVSDYGGISVTSRTRDGGQHKREGNHGFKRREW